MYVLVHTFINNYENPILMLHIFTNLSHLKKNSYCGVCSVVDYVYYIK